MTYTLHKLKRSFRELYPDAAQKLQQAENEQQIQQIHQQLINEAKQNWRVAIQQSGVEHNDLLSLVETFGTEATHQTAPIPIKKETYELMIQATGDQIEQQHHVLIDGLQRLKGMQKDDAGLVTAQILLSGALGIGLVSQNTIAARLATGAAEAVAAYAGVTVATVGVVVAIATLVIVVILIPIIYFMQKPANGIIFLINELDEALTFKTDYNIHGKPTLMTTPIPSAVLIPDVGLYPTGGLIATQKRENALIGTQYGFVMQYKNIDLVYGVEVPLTGIYDDNNCYCGFHISAEQAAQYTSSQNTQYYEAEKNGINLSIRCNSGAGSIAYYIARAYRKNSTGN